MKGVNEFRFSGEVENFRRITTRTGTAMISFSVSCGGEKIRCIAFRQTAESVELNQGDYVECRGHIQSNQWTDREGRQRDGWQCVCHEITLASNDDQHDAPAPARRQEAAKPEPRQAELFPGKRESVGDQHEYRGGPF